MPLPRSGLSYAPPLEWGLTAQWWGCDWARFATLDGDTQAFMIAVYRARHRIDAIVAKDHDEQQQRAARRRSRR